MNATSVAHLHLDVLVTLTAQWLTLWLGLSLLSRRPRSAANTLAAVAFLVVSAYLLSVAFLLTPETGRADVLWDRWLGNWGFFAPVLLLHAFLRLTGVHLPRQRLLLAFLYAAAALTAAMGMWGTLMFAYHVPAAAGPGAKGVFVPGPLEFLQGVEIFAVFALGLLVLMRSRRARPAPVRLQLNVVIAGMAMILLVGIAAFVNLYDGSLALESLLYPLGVLGCFLVTVPLVRYGGSLDGQLLRSDLKASLLGSALLMGVYVLLMIAAGAPEPLLAGLGWFVLAIYVLSDDLRAIADRAFYGAGSRAGRSGLRTAASYAGASEALDLSALSPGQLSEVVDYLSALDRAGLAAARLGGPRSRRLELLGRDEFAPVRAALGLPSAWRPEDGLSSPAVGDRVTQCLEPRERQALGLKYLGYSDKQMAQLMEVKVNVPRSYLGAAKHKLGLPAGAPLMLFVYLSGLVESDALPLLSIPADGIALPQEATQSLSVAPAEELS
jgi:DNA-binding CsgD family transcriptional regulator